MKKTLAALATLAFILGSFACGGADQAAKDATDAEGADEAPAGKTMEKHEGNRMEKADEEE